MTPLASIEKNIPNSRVCSIDDQVYLEGESLRSEYVLADTGIIWRGTANRMRPAVWKYAQFEKDVLECSIYLISKIGRVPVTSLGDAVKTSRAISAAVSSNFKWKGPNRIHRAINTTNL